MSSLGGAVRVLLAAALLAQTLVAVRRGEAAPVGCPEGNLLAGAVPTAWLDLGGDLGALTDGVIAPEGGMWNAPVAVIFRSGAASVDFDLGAPTTLRALWVQADANDVYGVWTSIDGVRWTRAGRVENALARGHGLRGRAIPLGGTVARHLRVGEATGDGFFSVAEVAAFCRVPDPFPPAFRVAPVELDAAPAAPRLWTDTTSARFELALALAVLAYLVWEPRAPKRRRLGDKGWRALALVAFATYFNFGAFHFDNFLHGWDHFHYFVGGKYFRELGYERLYECVAIADAEDGLRRRVELRKHTDLRTNDLVPSAPLLAAPERCTSHFTDERWRAFKADVAFYRERESPQRWDDLQTDHGFNGTPVWTIAGGLLANLAPASEGFVTALAVLDPIYLALALWLAARAFGWRTAALAFVVLATCFPARFFWTGGSFLRWDWLFFMVAAVAALKLDRPTLAGAAAAYAALLRIFPVLLASGPLLLFLISFARTRRPDPVLLRFFGGAALSGMLLVAASLPLVGGPGAYREFVANSIKHTATPLTNYMGLRTVVAYRPSESGRVLRDANATDPWGAWKRARLRAFEEAKLAFVGLAVAYVVLLGFAVRAAPPWVAAALGATVCAVAVELTSYYYAFILAVALAAHRREVVAKILLAGTAATGVVAWAPLPFLPTWWDEQYTWTSVAILAAFAGVLLAFARAGDAPTRRSP